MEKDDAPTYGYGNRPLWQWILIYVVIGLILYLLIYYFVFAPKGSNIYNPPSTKPTTQITQPATTITEAEQNAITLTTSGFNPATLTIKAGTTITFMNKSGVEATVNSSPHPQHTDYLPLNLGSFQEGGQLTITFDNPGTYRYHNHLNPGQFGRIVVQ